MAIIIPSKRIYSVQNNKIIDNKIQKIEININEPTPIVEVDKSLKGISYNIEGQGSALKPDPEDFFYEKSSEKTFEYAYVYFSNGFAYDERIIKISKNQGDTLIDKITKLEYSVSGKLTKGITNATIPLTFDTTNGKITLGSHGNISISDKTTSTTNFTFPNELPETVSATNTYNGITASVEGIKGQPSGSVAFPSTEEGWTNEWYASKKVGGGYGRYKIEDKGDYFEIKFRVLTQYNKTTLTSASTVSFNENNITQFTANGVYENFEPIQLQVVAYATVLGVQLNELNDYQGDLQARATYSIENNELLQTTNYYLHGVGSQEIQIPYIEYNLENIISQYKNGKETAIILCSINDYFDENGNKVIDIKSNSKMMFKEFDEVIPYIFTSSKQDKPMSISSIGTPKTFIVIGVRPYYDGAVWQELYLLEKWGAYNG